MHALVGDLWLGRWKHRATSQARDRDSRRPGPGCPGCRVLRRLVFPDNGLSLSDGVARKDRVFRGDRDTHKNRVSLSDHGAFDKRIAHSGRVDIGHRLADNRRVSDSRALGYGLVVPPGAP